MTDADSATPTDESTPSHETAIVDRDQAMSGRSGRRTIVVALAFFALFLACFGFYWIQTADQRYERKATDALRVLADLQERMVFPGEPEIVELNDGQFAKVRYETFASLVHMQPTESSAYPFEATITTPYDRFSTIAHPTRQAALADRGYYRLPQDQFYSDPQSAAQVQQQTFYQTFQLDVSLLWDAKLNKWQENSRGSPPPDGSGETFTPGVDD